MAPVSRRPSDPHPHLLLVEGPDDLHTTTALLDSAGVSYPTTRWVPRVLCTNGVNSLLHDLRTYLKASHERVGVVLDADDHPADRWTSVRDRVAAALPGLTLPEYPVTSGYVTRVPADPGRALSIKRFGVWMMPDNERSGALEDFLRELVPAAQEPVFRWAVEATSQARDRGAPLSSRHVTKGTLHAYLAWQEPPGRPFGGAIRTRALDPGEDTAHRFLRWLRRLFEEDP